MYWKGGAVMADIVKEGTTNKGKSLNVGFQNRRPPVRFCFGAHIGKPLRRFSLRVNKTTFLLAG